QLLVVLMGQWAVTLTRGHLSAAQALADQILELAERDARRSSLVFGHLAQGIARFHRGDLWPARAHLEKAVSLYDPAEVFAGPFDPGVLAWMYAGNVAGWLGFADAARAQVREGLTLARRLGRAQDVATGLDPGLVYYVAARDPRSVLAHVDELVQLATDHELPNCLAEGLTMRGWALAEVGQCEEGMVQLRQGIEMLRTMQYGLTLGFALSLLAEVQAQSGAIADARAALEEGLAALSEEDIFKPALLDLRGQLLAREGSPEAEASFREAIELARRQGAKMYELRATRGLARWLTDGGRVAQARRLLAPLYASFAGGFATPDLREAEVV